ncbi:MAG: UDP-N-acetylmuramoyl-L-alanyl-D-glutamate--2,6-diaminopimelate ligase [Oscillospiraceae bacterium]|nr:UDP-N-acetylmuramoyl-L-alanyl-D-glutamate--2,6-diaminopimelate ligase [Oscillospiraceae bacterium]
MTLYELFQGVSDTAALQDAEISAVTCDSRLVEKGSLFFCVPGVRFDGHDYAEKALAKGAVAVVTQRDLGLSGQIVVSDSREAYSIAAANFYGNPAKKLKLIGITGTNGKTTITYLIKQILESAGKSAGLIGTIHNEIGDMVIPAKHTTPDPMQLHAMLARMAEAGCEYVVMEVSSHALDQKRVFGLQFECAVFTNLTQDHLDYHNDMESYYNAKKQLFSMCGTAVINIDDKYGKRLKSETSCKTLTFSCETANADFSANNIKFSVNGSRFVVLSESGLSKVDFCMPGKFSVSNALAAVVACTSAGIPYDTVLSGLSGCRGVAGRVEILKTDTDFTVIRDYAHSPDGLLNILETVREFAPKRVVTLFGCAGNRDRTKRPKMAEIAARLSDFCILTSDNPRDEPPQRIIDDAMPGLLEHHTPHTAIVDRYDAIAWALDFCEPDDVLVLAGKGHEDYQVLQHGTIFFDEKVVVAELLNKKRQGKD